MKILVTGASGFIGQHLVKRLKGDKHTVVEWDIVTGQDVCDPKLTARNIDAIFHLACPVNPADYKSVALKTIDASVVGTRNMLNLAVKNKAKFLYVSSSEVYGELFDKPFKESDLVHLDPRGERTYYDASKLMGEVLTMAYHRYHGLDVRIVRPFNIYGPLMRNDDTRVIPSFMRKIKARKPVQITGRGKAGRTFCYIDDFIEGIIRAMFYPKTNGEVFNLGTTNFVTIEQLANMLKVKAEYIPGRKGEQYKRRPNVNKAKRILKWKPIVTLKKGLEMTWWNYR